MKETFESRTRKKCGRADLWIILGITVVLIVAVVVVLLKLLDQSEKHVETVKEMKVGYSNSTWNPQVRECEISLERDVTANPDRVEATFEQLNLSEKGIKQIARLSKLQNVNFTGSTIKDEWLKHLEKLPLNNLNLTATDITSKGLQSVARMKRMEKLVLEELPDIDDESIEILKPLGQLRKIHLKGSKITARGIRALSAFPLLTDVHTCNSDANNDFLLALSQLKGLEEVKLDQSQLAAEGMSYFPKLKRLRKISLQECNVDDKGAAALANLPAIQVMNLANNPLSDKGLACLEKCRTLINLNINDCENITDKGLKHFSSAKPACYVSHAIGREDFNKSME
jgi:hypothetical protein